MIIGIIGGFVFALILGYLAYTEGNDDNDGFKNFGAI